MGVGARPQCDWSIGPVARLGAGRSPQAQAAPSCPSDACHVDSTVPHPTMSDDMAASAGMVMQDGDRITQLYNMVTPLVTQTAEKNRIASETRDRLGRTENGLGQLDLAVTNVRASAERQEAKMQDMTQNITVQGDQLAAVSQNIAAMDTAHAELDAKFAGLMVNRAAATAAPAAASSTAEHEPERKLRKTREGRTPWADPKDDDEVMVVDDNGAEAPVASGHTGVRRLRPRRTAGLRAHRPQDRCSEHRGMSPPPARSRNAARRTRLGRRPPARGDASSAASHRQNHPRWLGSGGCSAWACSPPADVSELPD